MEWLREIETIPEEDRRKKPETMVHVLEFYKETIGRPTEDQSLEKFHHANPHIAAGAPSPGPSPVGGVYPASYTGMFM